MQECHLIVSSYFISITSIATIWHVGTPAALAIWWAAVMIMWKKHMDGGATCTPFEPTKHNKNRNHMAQWHTSCPFHFFGWLFFACVTSLSWHAVVPFFCEQHARGQGQQKQRVCTPTTPMRPMMPMTASSQTAMPTKPTTPRTFLTSTAPSMSVNHGCALV